MTWRRSITVWARNSTSSKIVGSGQNDTVVPVRPRGALPVTSSLPVGLPPSANSMHVVVAVAVDLEDAAGSTGR